MTDEGISQVCAEIHEWIESNLGRAEVSSANRCSSAPQCVRKRWFQNQGFEGELLRARSILVFATGDMVEHVLKYFIAEANVGPDKTYSEIDFGEKAGKFTIQHREFDIYKQETLTFELGGVTITGHADGWGKRNSDGQWELIEIKSAAFQGFKEFLKGEADYLKQVHALMLSPKAKKLGVTSARFFYMNKNNSDIADRLYEFNRQVAIQVISEYKIAAGPHKPAIPEDDPDIGWTRDRNGRGNVKLGYKCSYCPYKARCHSATLNFENGKPVWRPGGARKDGTND